MKEGDSPYCNMVAINGPIEGLKGSHKHEIFESNKEQPLIQNT